MLNTIMNKQRELQDRVDNRYLSEDPNVRAAYMRDHRGYLEDELAEALYEMPFYKHWKEYTEMSNEAKEVAWQRVRMELVDALHFFMNLLIGAGFTAEEVFKMYMMKNAENHRRQDEGYTADTSYRDQSVDDVLKAASCTVTMDDEVTYSTDFIAILHKNNGDASIMYNTDALSLGMAVKMIARHYIEELSKCSEEDRKEIEEILGEALAFDNNREEVACG